MAAKKTTKKTTASKPARVVDHLSTQESFTFALHVATMAVLLVVFITLIGQMSKPQEVQTKAVYVPVTQAEEVMPVEEPVLGVQDEYQYEYQYPEEMYDPYEETYDRYGNDPAVSGFYDGGYESEPEEVTTDDFVEPVVPANPLDY